MQYPKRLSNNKWVILIKENNKTRELVITFPTGAINQMGWDPEEPCK